MKRYTRLYKKVFAITAKVSLAIKLGEVAKQFIYLSNTADTAKLQLNTKKQPGVPCFKSGPADNNFNTQPPKWSFIYSFPHSFSSKKTFSFVVVPYSFSTLADFCVNYCTVHFCSVLNKLAPWKCQQYPTAANHLTDRVLAFVKKQVKRKKKLLIICIEIDKAT